MLTFGILTISNVRNIRNRVAPQPNDARNERLRTNDRQLIRMLLFQVLMTTLMSAPFSILSLYGVVLTAVYKYQRTPYELAIYNIVYNLFRGFYYTNPVVGFYIYTLTGPKFRAETKRCIQYGLKTILTATGLVRCLPLRVQRVLVGENQTDINNPSALTRRRGNIVHPSRSKKTMNMTTVV